jgi:opacity protein-like surface antigen
MKKIFASAAITLFAANSIACGMHSKEKQSVKPFENYYGVISGGYSSSLKVKGEYDNEKMGSKAIIGLGVKTDICENIKLGLNLEYRPAYKAKLDRSVSGITNIVSGKFDIMPLMLTGSYEFAKLNNMFTPYVDAGVGVARVKSKGLYRFASGVHYAKKTSYNFAYSAGLGTMVDIDKNMRMGLGYKFSDFGSSNSPFSNFSFPHKAKNLKTHDFLASLEVKF